MTEDGGAMVDAGGESRPVVPPADADRLDVTAEARAARLARRVEGLTRQLEARIARIDDLERQVAHLQDTAGPRREEAEANARKAREYDALMNTLTMRLLRRPREAYALVRQRLPGRRR